MWAGQDNSTGSYEFIATGATGTPANFQVIDSSIYDGDVLTSVPASLQLTFNFPINLAALAAGDVQLDGQPLTDWTILDGCTLSLSLPAGLTDGAHTLAMASGALQDVSGRSALGLGAELHAGRGPRRRSPTVPSTTAIT